MKDWLSVWWPVVVGVIALLALCVVCVVLIHHVLTHPLFACTRVRPDRWECR